eukprot:c49289_g1_i1 orf=45-383(-)
MEKATTSTCTEGEGTLKLREMKGMFQYRVDAAEVCQHGSGNKDGSKRRYEKMDKDVGEMRLWSENKIDGRERTRTMVDAEMRSAVKHIRRKQKEAGKEECNSWELRMMEQCG